MIRLRGAVLALCVLSAAAFALTPGTPPAADAKVAALMLVLAVASVLAPGWLLQVVGIGPVCMFGLVAFYRWSPGAGPARQAEFVDRLEQPVSLPLVAVALVLAAGVLPLAAAPAPRALIPAGARTVWFVLAMSGVAALLFGAAAVRGSPVPWGLLAILAAALGPFAAYARSAAGHLFGGLLVAAGCAAVSWEQATTGGAWWAYSQIEGSHLPLFEVAAAAHSLLVLAAAGLLIAAGVLPAIGYRPPAVSGGRAATPGTQAPFAPGAGPTSGREALIDPDAEAAGTANG